MPSLRNHSVLEIFRGIRAFINLNAGVTRGNLPEDPLRAQIRELKEKLRMAEEESEKRREQLEESRNRVAALQSRLQKGSVSPAAGSGKDTARIVSDFHRLYYDSSSSGGTWHDTFWQGVPTWKCPLDLWVYQEIIFDQRPDVIVETGTAFGGSALFLGSMCDLVGNGKVITIDVEGKDGRPEHERVQYITGSSTAGEIVEQVESSVPEGGRVLVILDSDHSMKHELEELRTYSRFVAEGGYLIVEDTNVNGHPVRPDFGPGPMEAVDAFLEETSGFALDPGKEKFYMTFNPRGFLRRFQ
jgi:cephalosporin hydroxylase